MAASDRKKEKIITANWSNLVSELLELILKRLGFLDIVHFRAVCSSWNRVARFYITSPIYFPLMPQTPLLMFRKNRRFFNLSDSRTYKTTRKQRQGRLGFYDYEDSWFVGSSYGWLVIFIKKLKVLHILNPLSFERIQIQLPSNMSKDIRFIFKAIISCDLCRRSTSSSSKSFCIVVCGTFQDKLGFLMHEDTTTTATTTTATTKTSITTTTSTTHLVGDGHQIYIDIICHNGMLYALSYVGLVEVWDFLSHPFPRKVLDIEFSPTVTRLIRKNCKLSRTKSYLVESMGELWFVLPIGESVKSMEFVVHKLDYGKKTWVNLDNLSNQALFISKNECISVLTRDLPEVRENFIYFIIEYWEKKTKKYRVGIYNFKEKEMVDLPEHMKSCTSNSLLFWIVPNPWIVRSM
ncbi:putative F-box protein At5g55150 [Ziziphus jujuba]|uniref:F-box protein At5g55150 n=1 Tax=Ziziphus jujuba TaxID=326968 RepID=A0A6P4AD32_ZIZJJ|nr:putative F-box protein At5g55150 [Ziziphus jujuba]